MRITGRSPRSLIHNQRASITHASCALPEPEASRLSSDLAHTWATAQQRPVKRRAKHKRSAVSALPELRAIPNAPRRRRVGPIGVIYAARPLPVGWLIGWRCLRREAERYSDAGAPCWRLRALQFLDSLPDECAARE